MSLAALLHTIPHDKQRYETCGDWTIADHQGSPYFTIHVSELGDWRMEFLVAVHELVEAALCRHRGITDEQVTAFDKAFEGDEPGESREAPYHKEHMTAYAIELMLMVELGVDFNDYADRIEALSK